MEIILYPAGTRGKTELEWLESRHSFSFGDYVNPHRMGFGTLRVLNDDRITPGAGFPSHPHKNMEIVTIVLDGALEHKDSLGTGSVIKAGDVQVMSAGTGIVHSEFNHSRSRAGSFLQIWITPRTANVTPRYDQKSFTLPKDHLTPLVSGDKKSDTLFIHQHAIVSRGVLTRTITYEPHYAGNGVFLFVLEGNAEIAQKRLTSRDAVGITKSSSIEIRPKPSAELLVIEVPIN